MEKAELGAKIRETRKKCGYTQEKLAEMAGIGSVYLGEIERGAKMPSAKILFQLAEAMDVSVDYILRGFLSSGKEYVFDEITKMLEPLTPKQRKGACEILQAYVRNL